MIQAVIAIVTPTSWYQLLVKSLYFPAKIKSFSLGVNIFSYLEFIKYWIIAMLKNCKNHILEMLEARALLTVCFFSKATT